MVATQMDRPLATSISAAARLTSLSRGTIRGYLRDGHLKGVKCGRRVLVSYESLQKLVRTGAESPK